MSIIKKSVDLITSWAMPVKSKQAFLTLSYLPNDYKSINKDVLYKLITVFNKANAITIREPETLDTEAKINLNTWPGEHYRLLAAFIAVYKPKNVVEIGTYKGLSALAMNSYLPSNSKIYTFDIVPWNKILGTYLKKEDFQDGTIRQFVDDISKPKIYRKYEALFKKADLIFLDASKDGKTEKDILKNFKKTKFSKSSLLVIDDIKMWNMLSIWQDIDAPKLDITSFGHWSGTGIVELKKFGKE